MAVKYVTIGSAEDIFGYDDAAYSKSAIFPDPVEIGTPIDPTDALQLGALGGLSLLAASVVDITSPDAELNLLSGNANTFLMAYQLTAGVNGVTFYSWDSAVSGGVSSPYIVASSSGFWIAVGGRYFANSPAIGELTASKVVGTTANKKLESLDGESITLDFAGGASGDVDTLTFTGGLLTGYTLVP